MTTDAERRQQLEQLEALQRAGALTAEQVREARARLQAPPPPKPSRGLVGGIAAFTVAFAAAGYVWLGTPVGWRVGPGAPPEATAEAVDAQTEAMLGELKRRLADKPDDASGWLMLGRSYLLLGRHAEAVGAFEKLRALRPDDAQVLVDLADAKAMVAGRDLKGEPEALILQALKLDPKNLKGLALAGTVAFDRGDYAAAIGHWENAVGVGDGQGELVANLRAGIDEAKRRLAPPAAASAPGAAAAAQVSGRVELAAALRDKAAPDDTLFVFARAVDGPRMPIALLRKRVGDLPLDFRLDDTSAMSPVLKLSGAQQVVIGARISRSGQAATQPGDLQGFSAPVAVGTSGVRIEIAEEVK